MKETKFYLRYATKSIVEDDYDNGENPDTEYNIDLDWVGNCFCDNIEDIAKPLELDFKNKESWMAFDDGRIIYQGIENGNGEVPTAEEMDKWKKGVEVLYAVQYDFYVLFIENIRTPSVDEMVDKFGIESYD